MNEDEVTLLIKGFIDSLPNNKKEIYDYILQNGIDMSDHALIGRHLPEGFTGFFYSSLYTPPIVGITDSLSSIADMWVGYVVNGTGISYINFYTSIKIRSTHDTNLLRWTAPRKNMWTLLGDFYDITNLVIAKPQGNFMNWIDENPLEVKG